MKIEGERIFLKKLRPEDVTDSYVNWMNDKDVTCFLECRWTTFTKDDLKRYVKDINGSEDNMLFGIYKKDGNKHIGNIKIGNINRTHNFADVGLIIGEKSVWGRGYGSAAITLITEFAFKDLKLNKLFAGIYAGNSGSFKAFMKTGYREVGRFRNHRIYGSAYMDEILVEKCNTARP